MADFFDEPSAPPAGAPSAPSGGGGDAGGVQIPSATIRGLHFQFQNVNTPTSLNQDQALSKASEDLSARLNDLHSAVSAQQGRDKNTTTFDKAIGMGIGLYNLRNPFNDPLAGEKGSIWRMHRQYAHDHQQAGQGESAIQGGYPTERDEVFTNAGSTRQAIQQWILAASKSRNYRILSDVQNHIPFETDTDELHQEKIAFWRKRLAETNQELGQRGLTTPSVPSTAAFTAPATSAGVAAPSAPPASGGSGLPAGFRATKKWNVKGTPVIEDDKGNRYYYDAGTWVKLGG